MRIRRRGDEPVRLLTGLVLAVALGLTGCGWTAGARESAETDPRGSVPDVAVVDPAAFGPDSTLDELLPILLERWRGLDQRVIDGEGDEPLAGLEEVWALAEPIIRADHQGTLFGYQQALDLARSAVQRNRPADASKGYRLVLELTEDLLGR